jgi:hypothetical protein
MFPDLFSLDHVSSPCWCEFEKLTGKVTAKFHGLEGRRRAWKAGGMSVVNFNKAKKVRDQAQAKDQAAANRAKFGQTKGQKAKTKADADRAQRALDGAKRED